MTARTVVVTGGAGFIGGHLVLALLRHGHVVRVLDDLSGGAREVVPDGATLEVGSVTDPDALDTVMAGADAVVHLAAVPSVPRSVADPDQSHRVNLTGTVEVLQAARRHGGLHTVLASSCAVYGDAHDLPLTESHPVAPASPYAVAKLASEQYALAFQACYDLPALALRLFNVYGPGQGVDHGYAAVVPAFVDAATAGRPVTLHGDGGQTRDFVHVSTVAAVLADAVTRRVTAPGPVNLASGTRASLLDLLDVIADVTGHPVAREHGPARPGDVRHSHADQHRLQALFPDLVPVSLHEGIASTAAWFAQRAARR